MDDKFNAWLVSKNIDIQQLIPELELSLRQRYEQERPIERVLVIPADLCQWPARGYWMPAITSSTYTEPILRS